MWTRVCSWDNSQPQQAVRVQSGDSPDPRRRNGRDGRDEKDGNDGNDGNDQGDGGSVGGGGTADTDEVGTTPSSTPRVWGDFTLRKVLGRGGMGMVWLATRRARGVSDVEQPCVVKTLRSSDDPEYERRFIDEARLLVLIAHKNICAVFDAGCVEGQYYLAMEHIDGHDLKRVAALAEQSGTPLPPGVVVYVVSQVLEALDAAHRMRHPTTNEPLKIVHRDVSPQNVMLAHDGRVKLIDFGLALSTQKVEKTAPSVVMGKLAYMAPEQARGEPIDARADQFAAGILLYEMLANARYYEGLSVDDMWRKSGAGGHVPLRLAQLPEGLRAIVLRATAARADKRYPSCAAMAEALAAWASDHDDVAGPADARAAMRDLLAATHFLDAPTGERPRVTSLAGRHAVVVDAVPDVAAAPRERTRTFRLSDLDAAADGGGEAEARVELLDDSHGPATRTTTVSARAEGTLVVRAEPTVLVRSGQREPTRAAAPPALDTGDDARRRRRVTLAAAAAGLTIAFAVAATVVVRERAARADDAGETTGFVDAGAATVPATMAVDAGAATAVGAVGADAGPAAGVDAGADAGVDAGTAALPVVDGGAAASTRPRPRAAGRALPPWPAGAVLRQAALLREHCSDVACTAPALKNLTRTDGPARTKLERQLGACYATCKRTPR